MADLISLGDLVKVGREGKMLPTFIRMDIFGNNASKHTYFRHDTDELLGFITMYDGLQFYPAGGMT